MNPVNLEWDDRNCEGLVVQSGNVFRCLCIVPVLNATVLNVRVLGVGIAFNFSGTRV